MIDAEVMQNIYLTEKRQINTFINLINLYYIDKFVGIKYLFS